MHAIGEIQELIFCGTRRQAVEPRSRQTTPTFLAKPEHELRGVNHRTTEMMEIMPTRSQNEVKCLAMPYAVWVKQRNLFCAAGTQYGRSHILMDNAPIIGEINETFYLKPRTFRHNNRAKSGLRSLVHNHAVFYSISCSIKATRAVSRSILQRLVKFMHYLVKLLHYLVKLMQYLVKFMQYFVTFLQNS
jgi:hypothetical protein